MLNISIKCILANIAITYFEKYTTLCQCMVQHQFLILIKNNINKTDFYSICFIYFTQYVKSRAMSSTSGYKQNVSLCVYREKEVTNAKIFSMLILHMGS